MAQKATKKAQINLLDNKQVLKMKLTWYLPRIIHKHVPCAYLTHSGGLTILLPLHIQSVMECTQCGGASIILCLWMEPEKQHVNGHILCSGSVWFARKSVLHRFIRALKELGAILTTLRPTRSQKCHLLSIALFEGEDLFELEKHMHEEERRICGKTHTHTHKKTVCTYG